MCRLYAESRLAHTPLTGSKLAAQAVGVCLQGGLSPLLCDSVFDKLVVEVSGLGFNVFGYEYDSPR
jgi:hypothetical protein